MVVLLVKYKNRIPNQLRGGPGKIGKRHPINPTIINNEPITIKSISI